MEDFLFVIIFGSIIGIAGGILQAKYQNKHPEYFVNNNANTKRNARSKPRSVPSLASRHKRRRLQSLSSFFKQLDKTFRADFKH